MKRVALYNLPLYQFVESIMNGTLSYEEAMNKRPRDVVEAMTKFEDFLQWVKERINPSIVTLLKQMGSVNSDMIKELALRSPFGYLSLVLTSKRSYNDLLRVRPSIFFEICQTYFSDVIMEEIVRLSIEKEIDKLKALGLAKTRKTTYTGGFFFGQKEPDIIDMDRKSNDVMTLLSTYHYWDIGATQLPSLSLYTCVPESFSYPTILKKCQSDADMRLCAHDMFKIYYPLALPHKEYCFAQDVLLMIHAWKFITIANMIDSVTNGIDIANNLIENVRKKLACRSLFANGEFGHNTGPEILETRISRTPSFLLKVKTAFNERILNKYENGELVLNEPDLPSMVLVERVDRRDLSTILRQTDAKQSMRYNSHMSNIEFEGILKLDNLHAYAREMIDDCLYTLNNVNDELSKMNITLLTNSGIKLPKIDMDTLDIVRTYYNEWIQEMKQDLEKYPYEQLFTESDLIARLRTGDSWEGIMHIDENNCPITKKNQDSNAMAIVVYKGNDQFVEDITPIPGCSNKWLSYLSRRLRFYYVSKENDFYNSILKSKGYDELGRCFHCKTSVAGKKLFHDPLLKITVCGDECREKFYSKHVLSIQ